MLIQFSFKNYKSFRDDTVLDLSAAKMTEFNAQLIFTTHDTWQLSNQLLRRDEIWFTEKDKQGVSTLYSLADFIDEDGTRIRKDESYEKNYLLGKYGAAQESVRTKAMKRTICLENMGQFLRLRRST